MDTNQYDNSNLLDLILTHPEFHYNVHHTSHMTQLALLGFSFNTRKVMDYITDTNNNSIPRFFERVRP